MRSYYLKNNKYLVILMAVCLGSFFSFYPIKIENSISQKENPIASWPVTIKVNPQNVLENFSIDEVVEDVRYIPLETSSDFLIGILRKVSIRDELILVIDRQSPSVLTFNMEGKAIARIGRTGAGPGEFYSPADAIINSYTNTIDIYSSGPKHKIIQYTKQGKFIREIELNYSISAFDAIDANTYVCYRYEYAHPEYNVDYHAIFISRKNGEILDRKLPYRFQIDHQNQPSFLPLNPLKRDESGLSIRYWNSPENYLINPQGFQITPKYKFDFGNYYFETKKILGSSKDVNFKDFYRKNHICCINPLVEMPKHIFFRYRYQTLNGVHGIYYKSSGKLLQFKSEIYTNPLNNLQFMIPEGNYKDELIFHAYPYQIKSAIQNFNGNTQHPEMIKFRKMAENIGISDNPVLIFYKLKNQ